ncbi:acVLRF1 family peptidyl-tRNA hydrolase [Arthrobacter sp.]|uniref:acVLRF1 family peptidyl-tRNA hydrolase n=1 Tax=Arthrobacter sp. TaxID=1667 RepID=UPI0026DF5BAB|nr:acVLRF1 family peptidyl-tRNA hydrolase [Arthrobacter sp.]MDO5752633.1 acVLRF1 family peptidyl-tRNA hydrolase [Arthrobacter sp.]
MKVTTRTTFLTPDRLPGWVERFAAAHGGLASIEDTDDGVLLTTHDGSSALLSPPWPDDGRPGRGTDLLERLESLAAQERRFALVLVRRGGYAVGVASGGKLLAHKVGSVSARSRGGNQAAAVVERVGAKAERIFAGHGFEYLATGGDKQLVEQTLGSPVLRKYSSLPRLAPLAVTDPSMAVLTRAAADFCAIRVRILDTSG